MILAVRIAVRFLVYNKWQSVFIVFGIAMGVAVQMFVGLLIDSLQANLIERTVGSSPHVIISPTDQSNLIKQPNQVIGAIKNIDGISIIEPTVGGSSSVTKGNQDYPVFFKGISRQESDLFKIKANIINGRFVRGSQEVVIGSELSDDLGIMPNGSLTVATVGGKKGQFKVAGIFFLGSSATDKIWVIGDIRTVQNFFGYEKSVNSIAIQVDDVFSADLVRDKITKTLNNSDLKVTSWKDENKQLLNALSSQSSSSFMIQFFVLISVMIAISSILGITVIQKSRQIGILKAMGLTNKDTGLIFIVTSFILGFVGATVGSFMGFGLFWAFLNGPKNPDGTRLFEPTIRWVFVISTWTITVVSALIAGFYPARRSVKLSPIEIIQNG